MAGTSLIGEMQKLKVFDRPQVMPELIMDGVEDKRHFLSDYSNKIVLVNLWATWCPPCVKELASLDALEAELGGDEFKVLAISMDDDMTTNDIQEFLDKEGIKTLTPYLDHDGSTSEIPNLFGLPTSYIIDDVGNMVARYEGDADWSSPEAIAVMKHFINEFRDKYGRPTDDDYDEL